HRHTPLPAVLGGAEGAAHAVVAAYDGVTTQLLLDKDVDAARAWLRQLLTALLTDGGTPAGAGRGEDAAPDSAAPAEEAPAAEEAPVSEEAAEEGPAAEDPTEEHPAEED
ncbi:TetR family transcriptional regulator, partial [Streptomyces sp. SID5998]|nr:TetR family transcriptional regulator [Streptomyces sp. SID5998]